MNDEWRVIITTDYVRSKKRDGSIFAVVDSDNLTWDFYTDRAIAQGEADFLNTAPADDVVNAEIMSSIDPSWAEF